MKKIIGLTLLGTGLALTFTYTSAFFGSKPSSSQSVPNSLWVELKTDDAQKVSIALPSLAPLVKRVDPAVLVVTTESVVKRQEMQIPPGFEFFFGPQQRNQPLPEQKSKGQGSGFIIHPSGLALTNNHVIEGASSIKIKIGGNDLKEYDAEVIGADENTDVALIKIKSDRKDWPVIPLGNSDALQVGDFAVAIGNPLGLELSVSMGIVSARGRRDIHPSGKDGLFNFIQIDAPINPGNSGGPLLNLSGEVVGINTAISASGQGIAFAIPIDQVKQILPQLKDKGKATRSGMGVKIGNVSPELAKAIGLPHAYGALVQEVTPGSPAQKSGVMAGDVITEFDGKTIKDASSLRLLAGLGGIGKSVPLALYRNGETKLLTITLSELPKEGKAALPVPKKEDMLGLEDLGLSVVTLDESARKKLGLQKNLQGARVVQVDPQSAAGVAGFTINDVIFKVNGRAIKDAKALSSLVKSTKQGELLMIYFRRQGATIFVAIPKP